MTSSDGVTINAHRLGRLLDQVADHVADGDIEPLHGIRLDIDATHLHAVATDRFTLAVARYRLNHGEQNREPWARTLPLPWLRALREWLRVEAGAQAITIATAPGRLVFTGARGSLHASTTDSLTFPDWRALLRGVARADTGDTPFPALDPAFLARWNGGGQGLRLRLTGQAKPLLFFSEDFIGAQMPMRYTGVGPAEDATFEQAKGLWPAVFTDEPGADMATAMPEPERPRWEVPTSIFEIGKALLHATLDASAASLDTHVENHELFIAHVTAAVHGWEAYRYLDALYQADPRRAAEIAAEVAGELDSGEIGEFAWGAAAKAGHSPWAWQKEREERKAKKAAKTQADPAAPTT
ncbi:hypothetical protein [Streptomyces sp. NPDC047097]|uniref:hypothetical protein n=1 Tax=Streptomyces sp. NPDC047097 TaxID=3155260 RepID=UPI0033E40CCB